MINIFNLIGKYATNDTSQTPRKIKSMHVYISEKGIMSIKIHLCGVNRYFRLDELNVIE